MAKKSTFERILARQQRAARQRQAMEEQDTAKAIDFLEGIRADGSIELFNIGNSEDAYNDNYVIYRAINLIADSIAQLPLDVYRGEDLMPDDFMFPNKFHSDFDLKNPGADMTLYELLYESVIYMVYRGEYMNFINLYQGGKDVFQLMPINPKHMKIEKKNGQSGLIEYWKFGNKQELIPNDQLVYVKYMDPDGDRGLSPVKVVADELLTDKEALAFNKSYFRNYGKAGGFLIDEKGEATDTQMREAVKSYEAVHRGSGKAHRIVGLPGGIKYQDSMATMKEMEFLSSRKDIRDRVLAILGIQKSVFGITEDVNKANAEVGLKALWQFTLRPLAIRIENKLNLHLCKRYYPDYHIKFDFSGVEALKTSMTDRITEARGLRELGYKPNEINEKLELGMEAVEDERDIALVPQLLVPLSDYIGSPIPAQNTPPNNQNRGQEKISTKEPTQPLNKAINRQWHALQRKYESRVHGKIKPFFHKQMINILSDINNTKAVDWDLFTILTVVKERTTEDKELLLSVMTPIYEDGLKDATKMAQAAINIPSNPRVSDEVLGQLTNRIKGVNDHTYNLIAREVRDSYNAGETIEQLSSRVRDVGNFNVSRSRLIARTESNTMISAGTHDEYQKNGVEKKQWITAGDAEVRETHRANELAGAIGINSSFPGTGEMYPSEPNCRCTIAPVVER